MTASFATLTEFKEYLGMDISTTSDIDTELTNLLFVASHNIETTTNRSFEKQVFVDYFSPTANTNQYPNYHFNTGDIFTYSSASTRFQLFGCPVDLNFPITLNYDGSRRFTAETLLGPDNYFLDHLKGIIDVTHPFNSRQSMNSLRIEYTAGYSIGVDGTLSDSIPRELKVAAMMQAKFLKNKTDGNSIGLDMDRSLADTKSGARYVTQGGLLPEAASLVAKYKRIMVS